MSVYKYTGVYLHLCINIGIYTHIYVCMCIYIIAIWASYVLRVAVNTELTNEPSFLGEIWG